MNAPKPPQDHPGHAQHEEEFAKGIKNDAATEKQPGHARHYGKWETEDIATERYLRTLVGEERASEEARFKALREARDRPANGADPPEVVHGIDDPTSQATTQDDASRAMPKPNTARRISGDYDPPPSNWRSSATRSAPTERAKPTDADIARYQAEAIAEENAAERNVERSRRIKEYQKIFYKYEPGVDRELSDYYEEACLRVSMEAAGHFIAHMEREGWVHRGTYDYRDTADNLMCQALRFHWGQEHRVKKFVVRRPYHGGWTFDIGPARVPYRVAEWIARKDIGFLVEGEKDADRGIKAGLRATSLQGQHWSPEAAYYFIDQDIVIIPDLDDTGRKHTRNHIKELHKVGARCRVLRLAGLKYPQKDLSDWFDADPAHTKEALLALVENLPYEPVATPPSGILPYAPYEDLDVPVAKPWLVKGVMVRRETSAWIGAPKSGKSALLEDLMVHGAAGLNWRGYAVPAPFACIYIALERGDLVKRRLEAYKRRLGLPCLPIVTVTQPINLLSPDSVAVLCDTITAVGQRYGIKVGLVIIDTYSKVLAAGGGKEKEADDANKALNNARQVELRTDVHIAFIGHTGKDESKGHRGSNATLGDVDVEVMIDGEETKTATVTNANDQKEGPLTSFTLTTYSFGDDEAGDEITTSIVAGEVPANPVRTSRKKMTADQRQAWDALIAARNEHGVEAPVAFGLPGGTKVVTLEHWKEQLFVRGALDRRSKSHRSKFARHRAALVKYAHIGQREAPDQSTVYVWPFVEPL